MKIMSKRLNREFFERKPEVVARELLGKFLVRRIGSEDYIGKIVETEAYLSENDLACHAARGKTKRNHVMFGPAGHAYVYMIYGMYFCLNFVTESEHKPSAVLIRAVQPFFNCHSGLIQEYDKLIRNPSAICIDSRFCGNDKKNLVVLRKLGSGPGKLCRWMNIDKALNGEDLSESKKLYLANEVNIGGQKFKSEKISERNIVKTSRIGVDYAGEHKDLPLRFYIKDNKFVSKR